jgi:CRISPR/Cas system-associated endonuclease Cas3-HD
LYHYKRKAEDKMMPVLETVYKFVGIILILHSIIKKITTYQKGKEKENTPQNKSQTEKAPSPCNTY